MAYINIDDIELQGRIVNAKKESLIFVDSMGKEYEIIEKRKRDDKGELISNDGN